MCNLRRGRGRGGLAYGRAAGRGIFFFKFRSKSKRATEPGVIAELDHAKSPFAILVNALETLNRWSAAASGRTSAGE